MKWNTIGEYVRRTATELSDLLSAHARISAHKTSAGHGDQIDAAAQGPRFQAGSPRMHEHDGKPTRDQRAALSRWEDEGGRTAAPAKTVAIQAPA